jgi:REP element-mobilizing transposase RayT
MARKPRVEIEGGLYHVITRGNNRQTIFHSPEDYEKFLSLMRIQKSKLPYFLYAYCLMSNHVHLLIERQADAIGRIMHRVLTGYGQYYNRRYQKVGHLLQGRHKSILCESEPYLCELVRYIHLNPVRAKMVSKPEDYEYSSHRSYLGLKATEIVDVDPVLRHFGARKEIARKEFQRFVMAGMKHGHRNEFYVTDEGEILGNDEFVDAMIHRVGQAQRRVKGNDRRLKRPPAFDAAALSAAVEKNCGLSKENICGPGKSAQLMRAKEAMILVGRTVGATVKELSDLVNISISGVSRRHDTARRKAQEDEGMRLVTDQIEKEYHRITNRK